MHIADFDIGMLGANGIVAGRVQSGAGQAGGPGRPPSVAGRDASSGSAGHRQTKARIFHGDSRSEGEIVGFVMPRAVCNASRGLNLLIIRSA